MQTIIRVTSGLDERLHDVDVRRHVHAASTPRHLVHHVAQCMHREDVAAQYDVELHQTAKTLYRWKPTWRRSETEMMQLTQGIRLQVRSETSTDNVTVSEGRVLLQDGAQWVVTDLRGVAVEDCRDPDRVVTAYAYACPVGPASPTSACFYKHSVVSNGNVCAPLVAKDVYVPQHMPLHKSSVSHFESKLMCKMQHLQDMDACNMRAAVNSRCLTQRLSHGIIAVSTQVSPASAYRTTTFFVPCHV